MTALGVLVQIVWPLIVGAAVIVYFHRCANRIGKWADQVEDTADHVDARADKVDATARELRAVLKSVRHDVKTIRGWMHAHVRAQQSRAEDPPTTEIPRPLPLTRDQRIRSEGAAARPPRHRMREPE